MKKRFIVWATVGALIISYFARVIYLNVTATEYRVDVVNYDIGESYEFENFTYKVKGFNIYTPEELLGKFGEELEVQEDVLYMVADLEVKCVGNEKEKCYISKFEFASGAWSNGIDMIYIQMNNTSEFEPNETRTLYAVALSSELHYGCKGWEEVARSKDYALVCYEYPKLVVLKCY